MKIFGLAGWSGSGKTTLMARLLPALIGARPHRLDDQARASRFRRRPAGQGQLSAPRRPAPRGDGPSAERWALMHEHRGAPEPALAELIAHMSPVDLVMVEGFKRAAASRSSRCTAPSSASRCSAPRTRHRRGRDATSRLPALPLPRPRARRRRRDRRFHRRAMLSALRRELDGAAQRRLLRLRRRADAASPPRSSC